MTALCNKDNFQPIFIVGASRSGTTMLNRVLGNHTAILGMKELHFFGAMWDPQSPPVTICREKAIVLTARLLVRVRRGIFGGNADVQDLDDAQKLVITSGIRDWTPPQIYKIVLQEAMRTEGVMYVTDQTPRNIFYAHKLLELYPGARILHLIRDPRAVLLSQKNRWSRKWLGANHMPIMETFRVFVNYHPFTMTKLWKKAVEIGRTLEGHSRYMQILYEDLVSNPEMQVNSICNFLGLPYEQQMLDVPQEGSSLKNRNLGKRGIYSDVVDKWCGLLSKGDIAICEYLAVDLMSELGYQSFLKRFSYLSIIGPLIRFPLHFIGVMLINPIRVLVQLKAIIKLQKK